MRRISRGVRLSPLFHRHLLAGRVVVPEGMTDEETAPGDDMLSSVCFVELPTIVGQQWDTSIISVY